MAQLFLASYPDAPTKRGLVELTPAQLRLNYDIKLPDSQRLTIHKQFGLSSCATTKAAVHGVKPLKLRDPEMRTEFAKVNAKSNRYAKRHAPRFSAPEKPATAPYVQPPADFVEEPPRVQDAVVQDYDPNPPEKPKAKKKAAKKPEAKAKPQKRVPAKAMKPKIGRANY